MKQRFELIAANKANYYTKGSPIQLVCIELLKEATSGEIAVCLSFKNVSNEPLEELCIHFKCRNSEGETMCEADFCYEELRAQPGEVFGASEAVYVSEERPASIDVKLRSVQSTEGDEIDLREFRRVRLPAQIALNNSVKNELAKRTGNDRLLYEPAVLEAGWQCACGAFHPGNGDGVYCDECGADRILVQNMIASIRRGLNGDAAEPEVDEQPTREAAKAVVYAAPAAAVHTEPEEADEADEEEDAQVYEYGANEDDFEDPDEFEEMEDREDRARFIMRWAPVVTALLCALVMSLGYAYIRLH